MRSSAEGGRRTGESCAASGERAGRRRGAGSPRFLLVRLSSLGDVVNALPTAHTLRRAFPEAYLGWVVDEPFAPLLRRSDLLDAVFPLPIPNGQNVRWNDVLRAPSLSADLRAFVRRLRECRFDAVLELQGLLRSAVTARLSAAPDRVGFVDERRELNYLFLNRRVPPVGRHAVDRFLTLAEAVGTLRGEVRWGRLTGAEDESAIDQLLSSFPDDRPLVALNPGASAAYKRWPADRFAQTADLVVAHAEARFVVLGSPPERQLCRALCDGAKAPLVNVAGRTTLPQLAALLRRCACLITGDTGPMHLAVAVGTPVAAIMGPTDPTITGPYGPGHVVLRAPGMKPAAWGQSRSREPELMLRVRPEQVAGAVATLLA